MSTKSYSSRSWGKIDDVCYHRNDIVISWLKLTLNLINHPRSLSRTRSLKLIWVTKSEWETRQQIIMKSIFIFTVLFHASPQYNFFFFFISSFAPLTRAHFSGSWRRNSTRRREMFIVVVCYCWDSLMSKAACLCEQHFDDAHILLP